MSSLFGLATIVLFTAIIGIMATELGLLWRAWRSAPEVVALRERVIASACRTFGIGAFMSLVINRLFLDVLSPDAIGLVGVIGITVLAIPATRFIYLYMRGGFHEESQT